MPHRDLHARPILLQGVAARESGVVTGLVNERSFVLYGPKQGDTSSDPVLASFRRQSDSAPSRSWPITRLTQLSAVRHAVYNVRKKHASILRAVAAQAYTSKEMVRQGCRLLVCLTKSPMWGGDPCGHVCR